MKNLILPALVSTAVLLGCSDNNDAVLNVNLTEFNGKTDLKITVNVERTNSRIVLTGTIAGNLENIAFPEIQENPERQHYLWTIGAFEMFVSGKDGAYIEYNFGFNQNYEQINLTGYRTGQSLPEIKNPPKITSRFEDGKFVQVVEFSEDVIGNSKFSLTAVVILKDGTELYFSNNHCGTKPDFHLECARNLTLSN